jgi:putative PIN family toxin of toxin-antitoxin system
MCYHFVMATKIVVDTSVFISALIGPSGPSREVIRQCLRGLYFPLMGLNLFCEYEAVSSRPSILSQCSLSSDEVLQLTQAFMSVCEWVNIYYLWRPNLKDEADNHLIELAIAGNASLLVTNNLKDFQNTQLLFPHLSVLSPQVLLRS